tara:strand:- start:303296 stop:303997 length:702 start_codon:yes stop_codon:yes gene_type:complete
VLNRFLIGAIIVLGVNTMPMVVSSEEIEFYTPPTSLFDEPEPSVTSPQPSPAPTTTPVLVEPIKVVPKPSSKPAQKKPMQVETKPITPIIKSEPLKAVKAEKVEAQSLEPVASGTNSGKVNSDALILGFQSDRITLSQTHMSQLEDHLKVYKKLPDTKLIYVHAYAQSNESDGAGKARSYSLSRALSVRDWLIEKGVKAKSVKIRALGSLSSDMVVENSQIPQDRVEVFIGAL